MPINPANFAQPRKHYLYTQFAQTGMSALIALGASVLGGALYGTSQESMQIFGSLILIIVLWLLNSAAV